VVELAACPLELPRDGDLGGIEVDVIPGEPEGLAASQPEDQDQDAGGIEGIVVAAGRFEEGSRFTP
jgi:hypothetical protein